MLRYAITDRRLGLSSPQNSSGQILQHLLTSCAGLVPANLDFLLIREKDLPAASLAELTRAVVALFRQTSTRILVARRPDVAFAAGAHGVHLAASPAELTPAQARRVFPSAFLSRSCHTLAEVRQARHDAVDAILFGPVFGKTIEGHQVSPPLGPEALREAVQAAAPVPVLALGGVNSANTPQCLAAGAAGIAAIRLFFPPPPPANSP